MTQKDRNSVKVLAYDFGGTKVAVAVINSKGQILQHHRELVRMSEGKNAVMNQLAALGKSFIRQYPAIKRVGIASAGPLDPKKGLLLDPTNFKDVGGKTWGIVRFSSILSTKLKRQVILENDAAAAILAECWMGAARQYQNAMILTLGTGLGTGVVCNGKLVRAGHNLHTEAGHIIINPFDKTARCECGNAGCAEAFLSGMNFARRFELITGQKLSGKEIAEKARAGDAQARKAFDEYALMMAVAIHNYCVIYAPEIIVFTGSFSETADLFLEKTNAHLVSMLKRRRDPVDFLPKLARAKLGNDAGLLGGAFIALQKQ